MRSTKHVIATETLRVGEHELIQLSTQCPVTNMVSVVNVYASEWKECLEGDREKLIQDIFPHIDGEQRELIQTGTTSRGWDLLFP